ncbi:MAG TPA: hypothetical protein VIW25_12175 [Nitrososphaeraceae archaeon]|jgi:hypothetical protein
MGNNNRNGKEIRIITDKPTNVDYTFVDDGSLKLNATFSDQRSNGSNVYVNNNNNGLSKESKRKEENDISYAVRRQSDKLKNTTNSLRFKTSKRTKAQSKQNHSPVYE